MIELRGKLVYDPYRPNFRKTNKARTLIVQFPRDDLTALYRWFVKKKYFIDLQPPMFGDHVTVVGGNEHVPTRKMWKAHEGTHITVRVSPHIYKSWHFWALPVESKECQVIRRELCLKNKLNLHLTIGREFDNNKRIWTPAQLEYLKEDSEG